MSEALLVVVREASRDGAEARGGSRRPVLEVVFLGHPGGAGVGHVVLAKRVLDLVGCIRIDEVIAPELGLRRTVRVVDDDRPRLIFVKRHVREDRALALLVSTARATRLVLLRELGEVRCDGGVLLKHRRTWKLFLRPCREAKSPMAEI